MHHPPEAPASTTMPWTEEQLAWLTSMGQIAFVEDLSWDLQGLVVTHALLNGADVVVKCGQNPDAPETVHPHMLREIRAYERWVSPTGDYAPRCLASNASLGLLVLEYLPGRIALGTPSEKDPRVWKAAGEATATFNGRRPSVDGQPGASGGLNVRNSSFDGGNLNRIRDRLMEIRQGRFRFSHAADQETVLEVCSSADLLVQGYEPVTLPLVPTHADNSPRNWMVAPLTGGENPQVKLIDFGRAGMRPAYTELDHIMSAPPALREAFMEGFGMPENPRNWSEDLRRSFALFSANSFLASIEWAQKYGDAAFEQEIISRASWLLPLLKECT